MLTRQSFVEKQFFCSFHIKDNIYWAKIDFYSTFYCYFSIKNSMHEDIIFRHTVRIFCVGFRMFVPYIIDSRM
jgi:hypothetical protein